MPLALPGRLASRHLRMALKSGRRCSCFVRRVLSMLVYSHRCACVQLLTAILVWQTSALCFVLRSRGTYFHFGQRRPPHNSQRIHSSRHGNCCEPSHVRRRGGRDTRDDLCNRGGERGNKPVFVLSWGRLYGVSICARDPYVYVSPPSVDPFHAPANVQSHMSVVFNLRDSYGFTLSILSLGYSGHSERNQEKQTKKIQKHIRRTITNNDVRTTAIVKMTRLQLPQERTLHILRPLRRPLSLLSYAAPVSVIGMG